MVKKVFLAVPNGKSIVEKMISAWPKLKSTADAEPFVKLQVEECETGYDTKKGVECYESIKGKNPVVTNPYSTGITLQLIPKAAVDKIPILSFSYGLSA